MNNIKWLSILFFMLFSVLLIGQTKSKQKTKKKDFPQSFTISKTDFESIMKEPLNSTLKFPNNVYINQSVLQLSSKSGDMHFIKLKLSYFPKSYLMIQENGIYSTIVFIMSDDKSVFYKGKLEKEMVNMKKCSEDDIVSE